MEPLEITVEEKVFLKEKVEGMKKIKAAATKSDNPDWDSNWADWNNAPDYNDWENHAPTPPGG